jgi:hypothetical protein
MNNEKQRYYCDLLTKYRDYIYFSKNADPEFMRKLQDEVSKLAVQDPEFRKLRRELGVEYYSRVFELHATSHFLEDLRAFAEGKSVEFDDDYLELFGELYQNVPEFRNTCDANEVLREATTYWLDEYHYRAANDEMFAARILLRKLRLFRLGKAGIEKPVELDETELDLLDHLYRNRPEFRAMCDEARESIREGVMYWLEERQRRTSKNKGS